MGPITKQAMLATAAVAGFALGGPLFSRTVGAVPVVSGFAVGPQAASIGASIAAYFIAKRVLK